MRICIVCDGEFKPRRKDQTACSKKCRRVTYGCLEHPLEPIACSSCNVVFKPKTKNQYRCSRCSEKGVGRKKHVRTDWKEKVSDRREWYRTFKKELTCERCGYDDPRALHFHHTDPSNKKRSVSHMVYSGASMETILLEIAKCECICANCHMIEHYESNRNLEYSRSK